LNTIPLYAAREREREGWPIAEEAARVSNGSTGLEIFAALI
jgi:hypothetical protein